MRETKKFYQLLCILVALSLFLAACGGSEAEEPVAVESATAVVEKASEVVEEATAVVEEVTEEVAEEVAVEEPTAEAEAEEMAADMPSGKLLIWVQQANQDVWEQTVLEDFKAAYPDIELEFVNYAPEEVANQAGLAIQGGTGGPDLGVTQYRDIQPLISLGGIMDITPLMDDYKAEFNEDILAYCETDGVLYCVPWDIGPSVTYYRRDIFEAAGLASDPESVSNMVATWDSYLDTCLTIKEETGLNCFPQNKANNYGLMLIDMLWQQGIGFFDDEGAVTIANPEVVATLEKLGEFWEADVTSDNLDWSDPWYTDLNAAIDNEDTPPVATLVYPAWMGNFFKTWIAPEQEGNWGVAYMPAWKEGGVRASMAGGSAYFIPKASTNPEAAWAFIEFMALDNDNQVAQYAYSDYFPTLTSTYDDPLFSEPDPYFGDQVTRELYADVAGNVPYAYIYDSEYYNTVAGALATAVQNFALGNMTAEEALQDAADTVRLETGTP
ncbi:MAG: extracellular solute-binding protein [Anaerolineae bacterium]|nr:extracellular solute-binding protein [Anaerolineae bacterium]